MAIGLDSFGVTFLARELKDRLLGRTIQGVSLGDDRVLTMRLTGKGSADLRFLAEPSLPLLCLARDTGRGPEMPHMPRFEDPLRECTISDVSQIDLDRIVMITARGDAGNMYRLYFELISPFPNLYLTDTEDTVLAVLFRAGTRTRKRILEQGKPYTPPASQNKMHPVDATPQKLQALDWQRDAEIVSRHILGVSPFLSREIVWHAGKSGSLFEALTAMIEGYRRARAAPSVFDVHPDLTGNPPFVGLAWFRPTMKGVSHLRQVKTLNEAACTIQNAFLATSRLQRKKASILKATSREIKRWEKAEERAGDALRLRDEAAGLRKYGEIIIAHLARIRKGSKEVRLPDIYSPVQEEIIIPLEPKLTPQGNADAYFKRARKASRPAARAEERLGAARSRLTWLRSLLGELQSPDITEARLGELQSMAREVSQAEGRQDVPADEKALRLGIKPRRYVIHGGWTVLVGRSAKENDILTHRYAASGDLWFHTRQAHGSHVVLRKDKKKAQVPRQAILEAAAIAAYHSKARTSKHVPVSYTEKRYVKKVRKGPHGLAVMLREKVVFVDPAIP